MTDKDFTVECNCCKQQYDNWVGSTPCCGSIAYLIDEDTKEVLNKLLFHSALGVVEIELKR